MASATEIKRENHPTDTYMNPFYVWIEVRTTSGSIYFVREKWQHLSLGFGKISSEARKTSRAYAIEIDAKRWESGKKAFFKRHKISEK